jgi:VanZ family protein
LIEERNSQQWDWKLWFQAFLCIAAILCTVPAARSIQKFVYTSIGRSYITYAILFLIVSGLIALFSVLVFKLKTKNISQYIWLFLISGIYVYFTLRLSPIPEEAAHFVEYGLLTFFVFRALSHRIRDKSVYVTTILFVTFAGITDEFLQWLLPSRIWDYRDIGFNVVAAALFILIVWKAIRPKEIGQPLQKISLRLLSGIITMNLVFLGFCLSNTPDIVALYTARFNGLSWLQHEEAMTRSGVVPVSPGTLWLIIAAILVFLWTLVRRWERKLEH